MFERTAGGKAVRLILVSILATLMVGGLLVIVGCDDTQQKEKAFKAEWIKIISDFEDRTAKDDKKGQDLVAKNDLPGVINLTRERMAYVDQTLSKLLKLYPPQDLRKLQVLSIYYLVTIKDRLEQQIALYDALINNRPTTDLGTVLDQLIARSQTIGRELGIELQKEGIVLKQGSQDGTPTTTPSSQPSTSPSQ